MQVAQRGTSSTDFNYASVDRFKVNASGTDELAITQEQSSDSPTGFKNSYKITVDTPETGWIGSEFVSVTMFLEQQDLTHLNYGSSDALSTTLSFWVKSSVTGTYSIAIYVLDTANRIITKTYTINSANTWEYKTITIEGDTNGSGFANSSSERYGLYFGLTAGPDRISSDSTSWGAYAGTKLLYGQTADVGSVSGATWQITGVQLESGDTATPFEHRSYGEELALCQRYYQQIEGSKQGAFSPCMIAYATSAAQGTLTLPTTMRANPSVSFTGTFKLEDGGAAYTTSNTNFSGTATSIHSINYWIGGFSGLTDGYPYYAYTSSGGTLKIDAEL
jgi:hypothetical protein